MSPACRILGGAAPLPATWRRDAQALLVTPAGSAPVAYALAEASGISGDGMRVKVAGGRGDLELDRLGADGPGLLEGLRRDWLSLRAQALRLADTAPRVIFSGALNEGSGATPYHGYPHGDLYLYAPDGADLRALHLSRVAAIAFDATAYTVTAVLSDGSRVVFSRHGAATGELHRALSNARERLAAGAATVISRFLPTLEPAARAALAQQWLPGRLLALSALESCVPGFGAAFRSSWLAASPRREEGAFLMAQGPPESLYLGYAASAGSPSAGDPFGDPATTPLLWLLASRPGAWLLEVLSHEDIATYRFRDDPALPALAGQLLGLPQFSREALYLPLEELVAERAELAIAARELPLLKQLRPLFAGRIIHTSVEAWSREVG